MSTTAQAESPLLDRIPDPEAVRARLGKAVREVELLRGMLRLSERAAKYNEPRPADGRDAVAKR